MNHKFMSNWNKIINIFLWWIVNNFVFYIMDKQRGPEARERVFYVNYSTPSSCLSYLNILLSVFPVGYLHIKVFISSNQNEIQYKGINTKAKVEHMICMIFAWWAVRRRSSWTSHLWHGTVTYMSLWVLVQWWCRENLLMMTSVCRYYFVNDDISQLPINDDMCKW